MQKGFGQGQEVCWRRGKERRGGNEPRKSLQTLNGSSLGSSNERDDVLSDQSSSLNGDGTEIDVGSNGSFAEDGGEDVEPLAFVGSLEETRTKDAVSSISNE